MLEFSKRLRLAIARRGISQAEFARRINAEPERVQHWVGKRGSEPDYELLLEVCRVLDTHPNYLLGLSSDPEPRALNEISRILNLETEIRALKRVVMAASRK